MLCSALCVSMLSSALSLPDSAESKAPEETYVSICLYILSPDFPSLRKVELVTVDLRCLALSATVLR